MSCLFMKEYGVDGVTMLDGLTAIKVILNNTVGFLFLVSKDTNTNRPFKNNSLISTRLLIRGGENRSTRRKNTSPTSTELGLSHAPRSGSNLGGERSNV